MTKTKIQIRWADIDQLQHVYNGVYQHYYDLAKSDYFLEVLNLGGSWAESGKGLITAQTLNNYFLPIEIGDKVEVLTDMKKLGTKSFTLIQKIVNIESKVVHSDSHSVLVGYNPIEKSTFELPHQWREAMIAHQDIDSLE